MSKPDPFLDACGSSLIFISLISPEVKSKFFLAVCLCVFFIVTYYMINSAAKIIESLEETNKILKKRQYEEVTLLREQYYELVDFALSASPSLDHELDTLISSHSKKRSELEEEYTAPPLYY